MSHSTVEFKEKEVLDFLDLLISFWREERDRQGDKFNINAEEIYEEGKFDQCPASLLIAICYIDAYQSIRASLFGTVLEET